HPVQVRAGRKTLAAPAEHDDAYSSVVVRSPERIVQFGNQRLVEGIVAVGPVHPDRRDAVADPDLEALIVHVTSPYMRKTPNCVFSIGALSDAAMARPRTRRVCAGSITPSSHRRAVA